MKIKIEKVVYPGKALGRGEDGIATFVDGLLEGETAEVDITRNKKTFKEAKLIEVTGPSTERITPKCPSYGRCGGCSFQHTGYESQVKIKEGYIKELLGKLCPQIMPCIKSPSEWNYRNKMEFSFFYGAKGVPGLGLHEKNEFNRYFPVPPCYICDADFLSVTERIKEFARASGLPVYDRRSHEGVFRHLGLRKGIRTGQLLANLVVNKADFPQDLFAQMLEELKEKVTCFYLTINTSISDAVKAGEVRLLFGSQTIDEELVIKGRKFVFSISPFSFFQTNTLGTEKLYETILELGNFKNTDSVLDLYCGTGSIGIVVSPFVNKVLGVEQVEEAVANADINKKKNNIENISFETGTLEKWVKVNSPDGFNVIILDPPRAGLTGKVIDFVVNRSPEKIIYVSCNPATLARDLQDFILKGGYKIEKIVPVDMFPQTYHIEAVTLLTK